MSTKALTGLRDYLCDSLSLANMLWLSKQLADYVQQQEAEKLPPPLKQYTMDEINAMLDEAERQAKAGESVSNEEVMHWIEKELTGDEKELLEMTIAV